MGDFQGVRFTVKSLETVSPVRKLWPFFSCLFLIIICYSVYTHTHTHTHTHTLQICNLVMHKIHFSPAPPHWQIALREHSGYLCSLCSESGTAGFALLTCEKSARRAPPRPQLCP